MTLLKGYFSSLSFQAHLEIPIPSYFISDRSKELQERKTMLTNILKMVEDTESPEVSGKVVSYSCIRRTIVELFGFGDELFQ